MPCTGPVQQEVLAQILRQRTASEYRKTHRGRSPCGPSAQAREPRRGLIKIKRRRRAAPIRPPHRTMPQDAERPARATSPCGPLSARRARGRGSDAAPRAIEKRPPRARRPALPQPRAAVLSAKAGLTAGFGMGPGDPRLCGRARGGRSPAAHVFEPARNPCPGRPWRPHGGHGRRWRIALGALIEDAKSSGY